MKRIVAYLSAVTGESEASDSPPVGLDAQWSNGHTGQYEQDTLRIEAIISDRQAKHILALLVEHDAPGDLQDLIEELLQKQIESAGPQAADLFDRIVLSIERHLITQVFQECDHVKTRTAARLGIDRNTLHKKLLKYQLIDPQAD